MSADAKQATAPLLSMRNVSKSFPGVKALDRVQLDIWPGEIHALMGENGAGKSTLMKILAGAYRSDPGAEIVLEGRPITIEGPADARAAGIAIIYQELALSPNLTVAENVFMGREPRSTSGWSRGALVDRGRMERETASVLERLGAHFGPRTLVGDLSIAERQMVEIAKALSAQSRILVMDEPTTALSSRETERLFALIRRLKAEGLAIIYISHRMAEVYELSDRVSVLRDGTYVGTIPREQADASTIVRMMVGRDLAGFYTKEHQAGSRGRAVLDVRGLTDGGRVRPCSVVVHAGEVVGLAGLVGAGRTELARLIFGAERPKAGEVWLEGQRLRIRSPQDALDSGIAYLTEDRKAQGLFLDMSCGDNINLGVVERDAKPGGVLDRGKAKIRSRDAIAAMSIRVRDAATNVGALSGGNQQKVLLSRLLETKPKVLILDEPTRGVDIGAKSEIYRIIDRLAKEGVAVLVISSELPEVVGIADRVLVMREGAIEGELGGTTGRPITQESIIAIATAAHSMEAA